MRKTLTTRSKQAKELAGQLLGSFITQERSPRPGLGREVLELVIHSSLLHHLRVEHQGRPAGSEVQCCQPWISSAAIPLAVALGLKVHIFTQTCFVGFLLELY